MKYMRIKYLLKSNEIGAIHRTGEETSAGFESTTLVVEYNVELDHSVFC